ncbi:hypothetical protein MNBD_GAMMA11-624 [hydrothermal vent metagenome]|uniref:Uncharacterized protein n=1 Tax=hydrothermal vent metagenome TaxID=652676 RepID=A0A3B0WTX6_9ZZZZ
MLKSLHTLLLLFCIQCTPALSGTITHSTNPETGLKGWKFEQGDMQLELLQRLPDQTRGFFLARGFKRNIANQIANACVFQTIIRNTGSITPTRQSDKNAITVSLKHWKIKFKNKTRPLKLKEDWIENWPLSSVKPAARHAFRWASFPTEQTFHPTGDYNWGMTTFGLSPGDVFNLQIQWQISGKTHQAEIKNIQCARDR